MGRLTERYGRPEATKQNEVVDVLHMLTSFETFDALIRNERNAEEVKATVTGMALQTIGVSNHS
jgi:hypothetical protein